MIGSIGTAKRKCREEDKPWMKVPITFPLISSDDCSDEPLMVEAEIEGYLVRRILVDEGASVEVMYEHCFNNLSPSIQ